MVAPLKPRGANSGMVPPGCRLLHRKLFPQTLIVYAAEPSHLGSQGLGLCGVTYSGCVQRRVTTPATSMPIYTASNTGHEPFLRSQCGFWLSATDWRVSDSGSYKAVICRCDREFCMDSTHVKMSALLLVSICGACVMKFTGTVLAVNFVEEVHAASFIIKLFKKLTLKLINQYFVPLTVQKG